MGLKKKLQNILANRGLQGFGLIYSLFLLIGLILIIVFKHGDVVLFINKYSREEWDRAVEVITDFGLGGYIATFMFLLGFFRFRYAIMGLFNLGLVGIFTSLLKNGLFPGRIRPFNYFYYDDFHRFLYTAELNYFSSFPSGHTMGIFAAMSILAYFIGKRSVGLAFFFVALLIGFSRIYLCQHFFLDVYVGSLVGFLCTLLTVWIGDVWLALDRRPMFQKPLYRISFKRSAITPL